MGREIPPDGSPNSKVLLIGECPGAVENTEGKPFVGPSGKLLFRLLTAAGIHRTDCYILNTVPVYSPRGIDNWLTYGSSGTPQPTAEFLEYKSKLLQLIRESTVNIIVPLGKAALYAVTGELSVTARRGSVTYNPELPGKKILPTIHPSAALRNYTYTYYMAYDFQKLAKEYEYPEMRVPSRNLIIEPSFQQSMDYINVCMESERVAFDIETTRTKRYERFQDWEISCLSLSYDPSHAICIPFLDKSRNDYFIPPQEESIWVALRMLLTSPRVTKVLQNGMFDASFIAKKYSTPENPFYIYPMEDTMVAQGILTPGFQKDLGFLCSLYTDEPYYKDDSKQHKLFDGSRKFWEYSCKDAAVLLEILPKQLELLHRQKNYDTYKTATKLMQVLLRMQTRGMAVDIPGLKRASKELELKIMLLQEDLNKIAGPYIEENGELNPNSPKQLKEYFFVHKGAPPILRHGKLTTDEGAMKKLALNHEEAKVIVQMRKARKMKSTYMDIKLDPDKSWLMGRRKKDIEFRMRTSFNPVGTVTGRLSSSRTIFGTGGNMQNLPSDFKKYIVPDKGCVLYEIDYSQAENRIVAYCGPERRMIEAFETGKDMHSLTGSLISGLSYEEIQQQAASGTPAPIGGNDKTWRDWGKRSNHALNYGMGDKRFSEYAEVPRKTAGMLRQKYHHAYPGVQQYQTWIQSQLRSNRTITNPFGRTRKFFERWGDSRLFEQAYSHFAQSTVSDMINRLALIPLYEDPVFRLADLLNQIHDSVILQIPAGNMEIHATILMALRKSMEAPIVWRSKEFSIPVGVKMGMNAGSGKEVTIGEDLSSTVHNLEQTYNRIVEE